MSDTFHLFVYGTLRQGGGAEGMLAGCSRIADATVPGTLYDIDGRYPALMLYGDTPVHGEVWRCPADRLLKLDEYEGVSAGLFRRVAREVEADGGKRIPSWIYAAGPKLSRRLVSEARVTGGDWRAWLRRQRVDH